MSQIAALGVAVVELPPAWVAQADADARRRQAERHKQGARLFGASRDGGSEYDNHLGWHREARWTELAVEWLFGLPLLPDLPYGSHFDTHEPWCVQVKPIHHDGSPLRLRQRPGLCGACPYVFAQITGPAIVEIGGWVRARDVVQAGRFRDYGDTQAWEASAAILRPITAAALSGFRAGPGALCPRGRPSDG